MLMLSQGVQKAKETQTEYYFPNAHNFRMNWEELINVLYELNPKFKQTINCKCEEFAHFHRDKRSKGHYKNSSMVIYNNFDPVLFQINEYIKSGALIEEFINKNFNFLVERENKICFIKLLSNMIGAEDGDGYIHKDQQDVMSFQLNGSCIYRIFKNVPKEYEFSDPVKVPNNFEYTNYVLNPGTLIFIPKGTYHQVVITEPRITAIAEFEFGY